EVRPGEMVAIVGPSGCGKSTLLKVMLGLAKPEAGEVCVGGTSLDQVGTLDFRDAIGVVMQDDQLVSGSIADNIALGAVTPDQQRLEQAAKMAALLDDVRAMPMGFHTLVGDMGTSLSGGQKQRVLLARALYKQPRFLFLDEATSHLDTMNESLVNASIRALGLTTLVIAHRPETIRMADRIIVVEAGKAFEVEREKFAVALAAHRSQDRAALG
ncbi:MAG TPA: ATP-binding cassette domain-containing protein, partial [Polyangiaceae bacterium]|nr:ATP-binding cassette domain-containing protein [Polyangiaceae bacterium]